MRYQDILRWGKITPLILRKKYTGDKWPPLQLPLPDYADARSRSDVDDFAQFKY